MRKDREKASQLRALGKSYQEIHAELGTPMGTLSGWFKGEEWSKEVTRNRLRTAQKGKPARMRELNEVRGKRLAKSYEEAKIEARSEMAARLHDPLFVGGVLLYLGEGDRTTKGYVRLTSINPDVIAFFTAFLKKACGVPPAKIKAYLSIYPQSDESTCRRFWAFGAGVPMASFTKSVVIKGRNRPTQFHNGSCTLVVGNTYLKEKLKIWVQEVPKELMKRPYYENIGPEAAMV